MRDRRSGPKRSRRRTALGIACACAVAGLVIAGAQYWIGSGGSPAGSSLTNRPAPSEGSRVRSEDPPPARDPIEARSAERGSRPLEGNPLPEQPVARQPVPSVAVAPPKSSRQLVDDLASLTEQRSELRDARAYRAHLEALKQQFLARGSEPVPELEEVILAEDSPPGLRRAAVHILGAMQEDRSLPFLGELLRNDADDGVRRQSARALANYQPSAEARKLLIQELVAGEPFSGSYAVVFSLSEFRNPADIPLFQELAQTHEDVSVRVQALHALGRFEDRDLMPFLVSVASSDPHPDARDMAEQVIRDLGP